MSNAHDRYAAAFAPRDPLDLARDARRAAAGSVQASLYGRLRRAFGGSGAGTIAWMMIHAADETHRHHDTALAALASRTRKELNLLFGAAEGAVRAARGAEAKTVAEGVESVVGICLRDAVERELVGGGVGSGVGSGGSG